MVLPRPETNHGNAPSRSRDGSKKRPSSTQTEHPSQGQSEAQGEEDGFLPVSKKSKFHEDATPSAHSNKMDTDETQSTNTATPAQSSSAAPQNPTFESARPKYITSREKMTRSENSYAAFVKQQSAAMKETAKQEKAKPKTMKDELGYEDFSELGLDLFSDKTFAELDLDEYLVHSLQDLMELAKPTQVQRYAIPVLRSKRDALIKAQTGSGKTLAYLIPIVQDLVSRAGRLSGGSERQNHANDDGDESEESAFVQKDFFGRDIPTPKADTKQATGEKQANGQKSDKSKSSAATSHADSSSDEDDASQDGESSSEEGSEEAPQAPSSGRVTKFKLGTSLSALTNKFKVAKQKRKDSSDEEESEGDENGEAEDKPRKRIRRYPKLNFDRSSGTHAIIIAPTRELASQIYEVLQRLLRPFFQIVPGAIMGGEKRESEKARLRKGVSILVATPGRLLDHMQRTKSFNYTQCRHVVLDEADRLLDLGFERDLKAILHYLGENSLFPRQTVLASATLNRDVSRLALLSLQRPVYISIEAKHDKALNKKDKSSNKSSSIEDANSSTIVRQEEDILDDDFDSNIPEEERVHEIPSSLRQHVLVVADKRKMITLIALLRSRLKRTTDAKIIVFFSNCDSVDFFYQLFSMVEVGTSVQSKRESSQDRERLLPCSLFKLHGNLSQEVRSSTFQAFSASKVGILLCTDVAARGLDVPKVNWIIQYDVPSDPAAYIHRIGRTARIGATGDAVLMLFPNERPYLDVLAKKQMKLNEVKEDQVLKELHVFLEANPTADPLIEVSALRRVIEGLVVKSKAVELKNLAINAFQAFLRSYATHSKTTKHIFHIKYLHLGHLCRNFGLADPPSTFGRTLQDSGLGAREVKRMKEAEREKKRHRLHVKAPGALTADEFSAM